MQEQNTDNLNKNGRIQTKNNATEIDLVEILYLCLDHVWLLIASIIVGATIAFSASYFLITPTYKATSKIYVVSASNDSVVNLSDLQIGTSLTADYQELMLSRPVLEDVINVLGLNMSYKELANRININNASGTRILEINAVSASPEIAASIANEMVNQANIYLPQVMEINEPNLVESAIPPNTKAAPSYSKNTVLGGLLGLFLSLSVIIIRYLMNDSFRTGDEIYSYFGIQPLAVIPEGELGRFNKSAAKKKGGKA